LLKIANEYLEEFNAQEVLRKKREEEEREKSRLEQEQAFANRDETGFITRSTKPRLENDKNTDKIEKPSEPKTIGRNQGSAKKDTEKDTSSNALSGLARSDKPRN